MNTTVSEKTENYVKHAMNSGKKIAITLLIIQAIKYILWAITSITTKGIKILKPIIILSMIILSIVFMYGEITKEPTTENAITFVKNLTNITKE